MSLLFLVLEFFSYVVQPSRHCPNPPPAPKQEATEHFAVDPLEESEGANPRAWFSSASFAVHPKLLNIDAFF
jgi:hypothetical protein